MYAKVLQILTVLVLALGFLTPAVGGTDPVPQDCTSSPKPPVCGG